MNLPELVSENIIDDEIIELFNSRLADGMSPFQIESFVVNAQITPAKQAQQVMREIKLRYFTYCDKLLDLKKLDIKRRKYRHEIDNNKELDTFDKELKEIEIIQLNNAERSDRAALLTMHRELQTFEALFFKLKAEFEKNDDDFLAALKDSSTEIETEYWVNRLIKNGKMEILATGRLSKGILEAISNLPDKNQEMVLREAITGSVLNEQQIDGIRREAIEHNELEG